MGTHARLWRALAGADGTRPGLPIAELLAPVPLAAIAVLVANDWWWKPRGVLPAWLLGKLSDVAGLIVLPLVITAALALVLRGAALAGANVDWSLRRWKLAVAIAASAALVIVAKTSTDAAAVIAGWLGARARIVADPTDLLALPALAIAWWQGTRTIARVPYGRVAWIEARRTDPRTALADTAADPTLVDATQAWLAGGPAAPVDDALQRIRQ